MSREEIPTRYQPELYENNLIKFFEQYASFERQKGKKVFIAIFAPPNITGSLHLGHALGYSAEDAYLRWMMMNGYRIVWIPGTDHAGIATQNQVEKYLLKEKGVTRFELGREKFLQEVWRWKEQYGNIIIDQFKKLGLLADWQRLRFTLDEKYERAVKEAFVKYYKKGLVYRDLRPVNYCFRCNTSLSDLEVEFEEKQGYLFYIKYRFKNNPEKYVLVATTRPETILGDVALAVNPSDERYSSLIGEEVILPILNKNLPIISDLRVDPKFGTGILKVTPAHSLIDYEIAQRHKLPIVQVFDEKAKCLPGFPYEGLSISETRMRIVEDLKNSGYLEGVEPISHRVPICYRCGKEIDIIPSREWFVKMKPLAKLALMAKKQIEIIPAKYNKPYRTWLLNIRDWCISRKIWWGQTLPVYYCSHCKEEYVVSIEKPKSKCRKCSRKNWRQTEEVFDTWFSSAIWPFAILYSKKEQKWYPADLAVSAKDILHLWDTRMIFSGMFFKHKPPFRILYINPTVLTKEGKRMSKSLGTGIDPLDLINKYGADALRFGLLWQIMRQQDIRFDETHIDSAQKFANKVWNAVRFIILRLPQMQERKELSRHDKWILKHLSQTIKRVRKAMQNFDLGIAEKIIHKFFWRNFCDVYLESCKGETKNNPAVLKKVIEDSLKLLHPFMPFLTQQLWFILGYKTPIFYETLSTE